MPESAIQSNNGSTNNNVSPVELKQQINNQIKQLREQARTLEEEIRKTKPPAKRGRGVLEAAKRILWETPNIKMDDLHKQVSEKCGQASLTVLQTARSDFFHTLKVLKELGALKDPKRVEAITRVA